MKELIINKSEANQRFDKYLKRVLNQAPNSFIYKMLRKKNITLNNNKADGTEKISEGDVVKLFLSDETFNKMSGSGNANPLPFENLDYKQYIDVIFENEDICVLNKPSGVLSQGDNSKELSLNDYFLAYLYDKGIITRENFKNFHPSISNRLDRNTSGLVLCGKTLKGSQENASFLTERDKLKKYYVALVSGVVTAEQRISGYLLKDEKTNKVDVSDVYKEGYLEIDTQYNPVEIYNNYTLLKIHLITGRTHQIRAHLASIGHPIIGDYKYGDKRINDIFKKNVNISSQLLHSQMMIMDDLIFEAPIQDDFKLAINFAEDN